jgi:serine protease inhibitor
MISFKQIREAIKKDAREYGYEGDMVMSQLQSMMRNAKELCDMIEPETDFPEWVQSKITLAQDYIQTANDYMKTEMAKSKKK